MSEQNHCSSLEIYNEFTTSIPYLRCSLKFVLQCDDVCMFGDEREISKSRLRKRHATPSSGETSANHGGIVGPSFQVNCETFKVFHIEVTKLSVHPYIAFLYWDTGTNLRQYRYLPGGVAQQEDDVLRGYCDGPCLQHTAAHRTARIHDALQEPDVYERIHVGETGQIGL